MIISTFKNTKILIFAAILLASCQAQTSFLKQDSSPNDQEATSEQNSGEVITVNTEQIGEVVTGSVSAQSDKPQVIQASEDSAVRGTSVTFPPGGLAVDTEVTVQPSQDLSSSDDLKQISSDKNVEVSSAGSSVEVIAEKEVDPAAPFTISIDVDSVDLFLQTDKKLGIAYRIIQYAPKKEIRTGLLEAGLFSKNGSKVSITAKYWGSYQPVYLVEKNSSTTQEAAQQTQQQTTTQTATNTAAGTATPNTDTTTNSGSTSNDATAEFQDLTLSNQPLLNRIIEQNSGDLATLAGNCEPLAPIRIAVKKGDSGLNTSTINCSSSGSYSYQVGESMMFPVLPSGSEPGFGRYEVNIKYDNAPAGTSIIEVEDVLFFKPDSWTTIIIDEAFFLDNNNQLADQSFAILENSITGVNRTEPLNFLGNATDPLVTTSGYSIILTSDTSSRATLSSLNISRGADWYTGLFAMLHGSIVEHLDLHVNSVTGGNHIGALAGWIQGNSIIRDVHILPTDGSSGIIASDSVGGLSGKILDSTIKDVHVRVPVSADQGYVGGITGHAENSALLRSSFHSAINGTGSTVSHYGGIAGGLKSSVVEESWARLDINGLATGYIGGIAGISQTDGITKTAIQNSYAIGSISGATKIGGLLGYANPTTLIESSYAMVDVTGTSNYVARGIGGYASASDIDTNTLATYSSDSSCLEYGGTPCSVDSLDAAGFSNILTHAGFGSESNFLDFDFNTYWEMHDFPTENGDFRRPRLKFNIENDPPAGSP